MTTLAISESNTAQNGALLSGNTQKSSTWLRMMLSVILGAIITFGLFAMMHKLIEQDEVALSKPEPLVLIDTILDIEETKTIVRPKIQPPPEMPKVPETKIEPPQVPSTGNEFTNVISIPAVPQTKLDYAVQAVDQQPRPLVRIDPRYPATAANNGIEGFVRLSFGISASGEVVDIEIVESEPGRTFDSAAKKALRKWRYQPQLVDGNPVGMSGMQVRLDFALDKK